MISFQVWKHPKAGGNTQHLPVPHTLNVALRKKGRNTKGLTKKSEYLQKLIQKDRERKVKNCKSWLLQLCQLKTKWFLNCREMTDFTGICIVFLLHLSLPPILPLSLSLPLFLSPLLPLSHSIHLSHSLYPSLSLSHTLFLISLGYLLTSKYLAKFVWYLKRDWERLTSNIFQNYCLNSYIYKERVFEKVFLFQTESLN